MNETLTDGLQRALADHCSLGAVLKLEAGESTTLWETVEPLGYADAFTAEEHGGIGLPLAHAFDLGFTLGRGGFPLPLLETAVARSLLTSSDVQPPGGAIILCDATEAQDGHVALPQTPGMRHASHALARWEGYWYLFALAGVPMRAGLYRPAVSGEVDSLSLQNATARIAAPHSAAVLTAPLHASEMAGSITALLDMTLSYANDRKQFGRAIGQFQALQMEIAVLAETVAFATMAARMAWTGSIAAPDELRSLSAKLACCDASMRAVGIAHAVHGAIGITDEYPLSLHARRLHEWSATGATAGYAARTIGNALWESNSETLEFVRERLAIQLISP